MVEQDALTALSVITPVLLDNSDQRLSAVSGGLQVGPIKIFPLYSTLPPQQQQKIFDPVSQLGSMSWLSSIEQTCYTPGNV